MSRPNLLSFFGAVITIMLFSFSASSASLSDIRLSSALNQNLLAEVTVLGVGDRDQLAVSLAPDSIWIKTGISPLPELSGLRFSLKEGAGGQVIKIIGKRPLREPVVEFILQVKTPQGTLQRWYTLFLDPPEEVQAAATVAQVAPPEVEVVQVPVQPVLATPIAPEPKSVSEPQVTKPVTTPAAPKVVVPPEVQPVEAATSKPKPRVVEPPRIVVAAPIAAPIIEEPSVLVKPVPEPTERTSGFNRLPEQQRMEAEAVVDAAPATNESGAVERSSAASPQLVSPSKEAAQSDTKAAVAELSSENAYGPVRQGETLYSIANKLRPTGVTLSQTMAAILRTNPKSFSGRSENLSVGAELYIPPKVVMTVLSDSEAKVFLRSGRVEPKTGRRPVAKRAPARRSERNREVTQPRRAPVVTNREVAAKPRPSMLGETVDETLPIAQTFPIGTSTQQPSVTRFADSDVPSKARAPRNVNPSVSTFTSTNNLADIPLATTYSLDYVAKTTDSNAVAPSEAEPSATEPEADEKPVENAVTENSDQELGSSESAKPQASSEQNETAAQPSVGSETGGGINIEQQRAEILQRAEEARKLAESARAEIERVKQRQAELVVERANQLKTAAMQLEKAQADKQALEALVAEPGSESTTPTTENAAEEATDSEPEQQQDEQEEAAAEPAATERGGVDFLAAELTSMPDSTSAAMPASEQGGNAEAEPEMNGEASPPIEAMEQRDVVFTDGESSEDDVVANGDAEADAPDAGNDDIDDAAENDPDSDEDAGVDQEVALQMAGEQSQPTNTDSAVPVIRDSPAATAAEAQQSSGTASETDWVAKAKNTGQQAVVAVTNTASAAASAMNGEPAELSPTDVNNFAESSFWANYFNRLKNGKIEAHNPILWAVLLGLLLLWLLSRMTGRKEKFTEPNDYGDLDGAPVDDKTEASVRGAAALAAGTSSVAVSKDPLGDANFHIDYGMHAQALDIVRAAKPTAEGKLSQQLLLKEADILVAQGDADGLHMLSKQQSDNAELQTHIAALEKAAEAKKAESAESESGPAADDESSSEPPAVEKAPEPVVDPLIEDLDSLLDDGDLLMDAAEQKGEEVQSPAPEPAADNNLVDFDLNGLDIPDASAKAAEVEAVSEIDAADDNGLEFDLDSLSAELDDLSKSSSAVSGSDGSDTDLADLQVLDEGLHSEKSGMIDELEELTAALGGDDELDDLGVSFGEDDGLDELAASLSGEHETELTDDLDDSGSDDELLVEAISEPAKPAPAAAADPAAEISFGDVLSTQLDLARAYSDMGDTTEARKLLETVIERGSERQIAEASQLLKELG